MPEPVLHDSVPRPAVDELPVDEQPSVDAETIVVEPVEAKRAPLRHSVELREVGPFTTAWCNACDWRSFARRSRPLARSEGADHTRLYSPSPMGQGS